MNTVVNTVTSVLKPQKFLKTINTMHMNPISNLHYVFQKMENSKQPGDSDEETVKLKSEIEALQAVKAKLKGTIIVVHEHLVCNHHVEGLQVMPRML